MANKITFLDKIIACFFHFCYLHIKYKRISCEKYLIILRVYIININSEATFENICN